MRCDGVVRLDEQSCGPRFPAAVLGGNVHEKHLTGLTQYAFIVRCNAFNSAPYFE